MTRPLRVDVEGGWYHAHGGMTYPELARVAGIKPKAVAASVRVMNMKLTDAKLAPSRKMKLAECEIQSSETPALGCVALTRSENELRGISRMVYWVA